MTYAEKAKQYNKETKEALLVVLSLLNKGQRQKLLKEPVVVALFSKYGIEVPKE